MKTIYFVRHGESTVNVGNLDICIPDHEAELTEKGNEQSRFIAERAQHLPVQAIIASPFRRTKDTAAMISETTGLNVEYSDHFIERRPPSSLVGMKFGSPESKQIYREWADSFFNGAPRVGDGDTYDDLLQRANSALAYLEKREESSLLVVSHGFLLRMIMGVIIFGESARPDQMRHLVGGTRTTNTGITVFANSLVPQHDIDPDKQRWRILVFNDHAHLG